MPKEHKKKQTEGSFLAALMYILTAIALVLFNKNVLSGSYKLQVPAFMPLVQQVVIFVGLVALDKAGVINSLPPLNSKTLLTMLPVSVAFLFYLILGMLALRGVSIPMYASLRRFTVVFVMSFDYLISGITHSTPVTLTVALQIMGCVLAAVNDLEYNPSGYAYIFLYNAATAIYLVIIKHVKTRNDFLNSFSMMYLNSVMLIPTLIVTSYVLGDIDRVRQFEHVYEMGFIVSFLASAILAFVLNYAIFWNTSANSALTQTVSGQIKDIGTVLLGYIAFPPDALNFLNICGVTLGFAGSLSYAYVKYGETVNNNNNKK